MFKNLITWIKTRIQRLIKAVRRLLRMEEKLGTMVLNGGQRLYELEVKTGKLRELSMEGATVVKKTGAKVLKVKIRKGCDYFKSFSRKAAEAKAKQRYLKKY